MVKKLKFLSPSPIILRLALKAALITLGLFLVYETRFNFFAVLIYFLMLLRLFFIQVHEKRLLKVSYWLIPVFYGLILFLLGKGEYETVFLYYFFAFLGAGGLMFITLGLNELVLKNPFRIYGVFNTILIFLTVLLYFIFHQMGLFPIILNILLFIILFWLFRETFIFFEVDLKKLIVLSGLTLALFALEMALLGVFLPLDVASLAILITLILFITRDILITYFKGQFNTKFLLEEITSIILVGMFIVLISSL